MLKAPFSKWFWLYLFYYQQWKNPFPWCQRQKGCRPHGKAWGLAPPPGLVVIFTFLMPLPQTLLLIFSKTAGSSAMFLPPTAKSKMSQKNETQQPGAKPGSPREFRGILGRHSSWWGQNRCLFLGFHLFSTAYRMRIGARIEWVLPFFLVLYLCCIPFSSASGYYWRFTETKTQQPGKGTESGAWPRGPVNTLCINDECISWGYKNAN